LHASSLRATLIMVLHRAAWLRLLVTALFCVVGVARPLAQRFDATAAVQANEPRHVAASTREGELTVLRKRGGAESSDDDALLAEVRPDRLSANHRHAELGASRDARPSSGYAEHLRARGPPSV